MEVKTQVEIQVKTNAQQFQEDLDALMVSGRFSYDEVLSLRAEHGAQYHDRMPVYMFPDGSMICLESLEK